MGNAKPAINRQLKNHLDDLANKWHITGLKVQCDKNNDHNVKLKIRVPKIHSTSVPYSDYQVGQMVCSSKNRPNDIDDDKYFDLINQIIISQNVFKSEINDCGHYVQFKHADAKPERTLGFLKSKPAFLIHDDGKQLRKSNIAAQKMLLYLRFSVTNEFKNNKLNEFQTTVLFNKIWRALNNMCNTHLIVNSPEHHVPDIKYDFLTGIGFAPLRKNGKFYLGSPFARQLVSNPVSDYNVINRCIDMLATPIKLLTSCDNPDQHKYYHAKYISSDHQHTFPTVHKSMLAECLEPTCSITILDRHIAPFYGDLNEYSGGFNWEFNDNSRRPYNTYNDENKTLINYQNINALCPYAYQLTTPVYAERLALTKTPGFHLGGGAVTMPDEADNDNANCNLTKLATSAPQFGQHDTYKINNHEQLQPAEPSLNTKAAAFEQLFRHNLLPNGADINGLHIEHIAATVEGFIQQAKQLYSNGAINTRHTNKIVNRYNTRTTRQKNLKGVCRTRRIIRHNPTFLHPWQYINDSETHLPNTFFTLEKAGDTVYPPDDSSEAITDEAAASQAPQTPYYLMEDQADEQKPNTQQAEIVPPPLTP